MGEFEPEARGDLLLAAGATVREERPGPLGNVKGALVRLTVRALVDCYIRNFEPLAPEAGILYGRRGYWVLLNKHGRMEWDDRRGRWLEYPPAPGTLPYPSGPPRYQSNAAAIGWLVVLAPCLAAKTLWGMLPCSGPDCPVERRS